MKNQADQQIFPTTSVNPHNIAVALKVFYH